MPPQAQEPDRAFGRDRRGSEGSGHDNVERFSEVGTAGGCLGPLLDHLDPVGEPEFFHRFPEEPAPPLPGFEQHHPELGSGLNQYQSRQPTAAPEVEAAGRSGGDASRLAQGVFDVAADGPGAEEAEFPGPPKDLVKVGGDRQTARMTTRRRGSSPSEIVATPSISLTVSCTTLRSPGDIGSKTWSRPDSSARWAA